MTNETAKRRVLVIRSWPKMIFLWPTALVSLFAGLGTLWGAEATAEMWGHIFVTCMFLNLTVLTFDFPRSTSLTVFVLMITLALGIVLINQRYGIIGPMQEWIAALHIRATSDFYFAVFASMVVLYTGMAVITRFDYWEVTNNELIHHTGLLGDVERFSTAGLKLNTEINDVFEYVLAGAGRIIMNVPGHPRPFVLDNVLRINRVLTMSNDLLSRRVVEVSPSESAKHRKNRLDSDQHQQSAEYE